MTIRKTLATAAIIAVTSFGLAGVAGANTVWHPTNTQEGFTFKPDHAKSDKTREQVQNEAKLARDFGAGKVSPDGWRYVGGERGWVLEGHKIDYVDGKWVHTDKMDHSGKKPSPKMSAKEQAQYDALYGKSGN